MVHKGIPSPSKGADVDASGPCTYPSALINEEDVADTDQIDPVNQWEQTALALILSVPHSDERYLHTKFRSLEGF